MNGRRFIEHPLMKPSSIEYREYQWRLVERCAEENMLVVLPTGLGKTVVALLAAAEILRRDSSGRCYFLAPTRPLVYQHYRVALKLLNIPSEEMSFVTGEDDPLLRFDKWAKRFVCATPQVLLSDFRRGRVDLRSVALIIFDEAHRAIGDYAYCEIGRLLIQDSPQGRRLGFTASPPPDSIRLNAILSALGLSSVVAKDEGSPDVSAYVQETSVEWIKVELSPELAKIRELLVRSLEERTNLLRDAGLLDKARAPSLNALLQVRESLDVGTPPMVKAALYQGIRISQLITLLETQGLRPFLDSLHSASSVKPSWKSRWIKQDPLLAQALSFAEQAAEAGIEHPKLKALCNILGSIEKGQRALVFTSFRDTTRMLAEAISSSGIRVGVLVGKGGRGGLRQTEQIDLVERLRDGEIDVLIATQVGEEGLDIAECNRVVFYDSVPSAVRYIQRRGRTGRTAPGSVHILLTKGTRDEAFYYIAKRRVRALGKLMDSSATKSGSSTASLDRFLRH